MEKYRPEYHFSPEKYIINDPNGLVYDRGEYHLFHQYNIEEKIHWGHAVSTDLVHWEKLPNALFPDNIGNIWSGSAVVDAENERLAAFFTYSEYGTGAHSQGMAHSYDRGRTWIKNPNNPILVCEERKDFRDPKVFWYEPSRKWVMVLSGGTEVMIYESHDLENWKWMSNFGKKEGSHDGIWECPDLFPIEYGGVRYWVLLVSINDGSPAGGTGMQYFIGRFDGNCFTNLNTSETVLWLDHGKDFYAGATWNNVPDGRRLIIAWADNWQYRDALPTQPFKGQMSFIREIKLKMVQEKLRIVQKPVEEISNLRKRKYNVITGKIGDGRKAILPCTELCQEINLEFHKCEVWPEEFGIRLMLGAEKELAVLINAKAGECIVDRRNAGINAHPDFPGRYTGPMTCHKDSIKLRMLLDVSQTELFINDGETVMSNLFFPETQKTEIVVYAKGGMLQKVTGKIYSIW